MKNTKKDSALWGTITFYGSALLISLIMLPMVARPITQVGATVASNPGNSLSGMNDGFVNRYNSWAYSVAFSLSGTLDAGNTLSVTAMDGSGKIATGSFLSLSGGESTGSVFLDFRWTGWREWSLTYSGAVYSGSIATTAIASGMTMTGKLDTLQPGITLSSPLTTTITWATSFLATTTESVTGFTVNDLSLTNATATGFVATSATGYAFTVTPSTSTGIVTVSVGTSAFADAAGNTGIGSNILSYTNLVTDNTSPAIAITSHSSGATVSGSPVVSGTFFDSGGLVSVSVNGGAATLGSGTWSKTLSNLAPGANTITAVATDNSGNTGSTNIQAYRTSLVSHANIDITGITSAIVTFDTDLSATGIVRYGTGSGLLNLVATGSSFGTAHSLTLTGLTTSTVYYCTVEWQGGFASSVLSFTSATVVDATTATWNVSMESPAYLSGSTATGVVFLGSGTLSLSSLSSSGSSLSVPHGGLVITALSGNWNWMLQAPETTNETPNFSLSGYAFTGTAYQIGNAHTELVFSGQTVTVSIQLASSLSGQIAKAYRSTNQGGTYSEIATCTVTSRGNCLFATNQLSLFAIALPADTVPDAFVFTSVTNGELSTSYASNTVVITGIDAPASISVSGGEYRTNTGSYTTIAGQVSSGSSVTVRAITSGSYVTNSSAVLTIGWVPHSFNLRTKSFVNTGGGGGGVSIDQCSGLDYSPSYYDGTCGTPGMGDGNLDIGGNIITGVDTGSFVVPPATITSMSDVRMIDIAGNWAEAYILRLVVRNIVNNVEYFHPDARLTRAEYLKIVINATGWQLPTTNVSLPFEDVSLSDWYAPYTSLAISKGMINGEHRNFHPNAAITRAEATKILTVALWVTVTTPDTLSFRDVDSESDLAKYIEAAKYLDIISGQIVNGHRLFRPNDGITRAEIAKIVARAFQL